MLVAMGIADGSRGFRAGWVSLVVGPVVVVVVAALSALWHVGDIALLLVAAAATVVGRILGRRAERTGEQVIGPLGGFFGGGRVVLCCPGGDLRCTGSWHGGCRGQGCRSVRCRPRSC